VVIASATTVWHMLPGLKNCRVLSITTQVITLFYIDGVYLTDKISGTRLEIAYIRRIAWKLGVISPE
jgi:hypothetical protein